MHFGFRMVILIATGVISAEVVVYVFPGTTALLDCEHVPGNTSIMITWQVHLLQSLSCLMSTKDKDSYNNCSERIINKNVSLEILNTHLTDRGNYTCEVADDTGTFCNTVILEILVQPSVSLEINRDGLPECQARGGSPVANISWIPESKNVTTRSELQPDKTWTVISTYDAKLVHWNELICEIYHPAFTNSQIIQITMSGAFRTGNSYVWIVVPIALVVVFGFFFYWTRKNLRICTSMGIQNNNRENKEDLEPYASYVQKINTIYSSEIKRPGQRILKKPESFGTLSSI
ncbi:cell surface glycoprotein CD200 receptor 1-like [Spea bombifrons]|uniref:cell surface glycoprotein CD200 receptor 1-like n=1 Tax=Spea bombifrons TaxID=233779 RepID=UPI00234A4BE0|nr:cell surface glycoprotein CD200 receptor 1-like [Spea bombifrons]